MVGQGLEVPTLLGEMVQSMNLELCLEVSLGPTMVEQWMEDIVHMAVVTLREHRDTPSTEHGIKEEGVISE